MPLYAVVLIGPHGVLGGRSALRVVTADRPRDAVEEAHPFPPSDDVKHAWVHELAGTASLVEVVVDNPKWGRLREDVSS